MHAQPFFESPPGHEYDGLDSTPLAPPGGGDRAARPLGTSSVGLVGGYGGGGGEARGLATTSVGQASGGAGGIVGYGGGTRRADRALGTRSVGFPGFGPIIPEGSESAGLVRGNSGRRSYGGGGSGSGVPLGRGSVGHEEAVAAAAAAAAGRGGMGGGGASRPLGRGSVGSSVPPSGPDAGFFFEEGGAVVEAPPLSGRPKGGSAKDLPSLAEGEEPEPSVRWAVKASLEPEAPSRPVAKPPWPHTNL